MSATNLKLVIRDMDYMMRQSLTQKHMSKQTTKSAKKKDDSKRYKQGAILAIISLVLFVLIEAWGYYAVKTIKADFLAYQYFRFLLELPMLFFFYMGHKWALWLIRIGFIMATPAAAFLCVLLIHKNVYMHIVWSAPIPVILSVAGCWILFGAETFTLHFKHKRHARSIYD